MAADDHADDSDMGAVTLARWAWLAWHDDDSDELYGESTSLDVAEAVARRLSQEAVIDGRPHPIALYQEPGHRLLARYQIDGSVERLAEPTADRADATAPPSAQSHYGHGAGRERAPGTTVGEELNAEDAAAIARFQELNARRARYGVPADGRYYEGAIDYVVAVDPDTDEALFVEREHDKARAKALALRAGGRTLVLLSSRDLEPLVETL